MFIYGNCGTMFKWFGGSEPLTIEHRDLAIKIMTLYRDKLTAAELLMSPYIGNKDKFLTRELGESYDDHIDDLFEDIDEFSSHLEGVHSLETFYGDETLQNLIRHSKELLVEFDQYENILDLTKELELEDEIDDETED